MDNKKYAIRSSANIEDGEVTSFAGQFDTYLNVSKKDVNKMIKKCFLSLYNDNVISYLKEKKIDIKKLRMNVVVQEMVDAVYSGIMFTANPSGILNESVIVVGRGLGEGVVSDKTKTTSYYYNLDDNIYYYEGKKDYLNKEMIDKIIDVSKKIKKILGEYLDIEFAISNNEVYILQARNITTINGNNPLIMDNSNIVESYPGISLPLTCSFVNVIYSGVFKGVCSRLLQDKKELKKLDKVFKNMVGNANGRMYYKISNWYTVISCLPFSNKIIPIWQEMLGVKNKKVVREKTKFNLFKRIKVYFNAFVSLITVPKKMDDLNKEFILVNDYFYKEYEKGLNEEKVITLYNKIKTRLLSCWDITLINDLYTFIFTALFKKRFMKKYKKDKDLANEYISGISNIESMKPIKELINLAYYSNSLSKSEFNNRVDSYIRVYGDRNLEELKLESETFRTNKKLLLEKIRVYNSDKKKLEESFKSMNNNFKNNNLNIDELDFITRFLLRKCQIGIKNREISRLNRSRIFGIVREMMLYLGEEFYKEKLISSKRDIFYLEIDEVFSLVRNKRNMKDIINKRKEEYKIFSLLPSYSRIVFQDKEFDKHHVNVNANEEFLDSDYIKGIPCSNGKVKGEALIIDDVRKIKDVSGKILITKMTDPGWVFLLATAKGVISEKGSILSHTAIISRELKIPSIVGVNNLLNIIHNKDIIEMDGTTGDITIIKRRKK